MSSATAKEIRAVEAIVSELKAGSRAANLESKVVSATRKMVKTEPITTVAVKTEIPASTQAGGRDVPSITEPQKLKLPVRTTPRTLEEQLVLKDARAGGGREIDELIINDPRYPKELWMKKECFQYTHDGKQINVHYWENRLSGERTGFKFKNE